MGTTGPRLYAHTAVVRYVHLSQTSWPCYFALLCISCWTPACFSFLGGLGECQEKPRGAALLKAHGFSQ